jgi:hypothetical protein
MRQEIRDPEPHGVARERSSNRIRSPPCGAPARERGAVRACLFFHFRQPIG